MPLANFTPNQFRVHVFSSSSKRAREPQPNNYIIYSFDQGKRHKFSNSLNSIHFTRFIIIVDHVPLRTFLDRFKVWKKGKRSSRLFMYEKDCILCLLRKLSSCLQFHALTTRLPSEKSSSPLPVWENTRKNTGNWSYWEQVNGHKHTNRRLHNLCLTSLLLSKEKLF